MEITLNLKGEKIHPSAIVDTGFNGYLSVPREMVERSGWEFLGFEDYELANGELALEEVFWGRSSLMENLRKYTPSPPILQIY